LRSYLLHRGRDDGIGWDRGESKHGEALALEPTIDVCNGIVYLQEDVNDKLLEGY
jgi:hypothetical protein